MKRALLSVLICLTAADWVTAEETATQCPDPPKIEKERRKLAGTWFAKAQAFAEAEQYGDAVTAFECSFRMVEHPDTVFNAARAARLGGDKAAAVRFARKYLELAPEGEVAGEAAKIIVELKDTVAGGAPAEPSAEETPEETAAPEETPPLEAPDRTAAESETGAPSVLEEATQQTEEQPATGLAIAGYVSLAVGGAGLVVGAVLQGLTSKAWADGKDTNSYDEFKQYKNKMSGLQTGALAGLIAGGIVAGAGVVMVVMGRRDKKEQVKVGLSPAGVGVSGGF
jgi:hypothetical protein